MWIFFIVKWIDLAFTLLTETVSLHALLNVVDDALPIAIFVHAFDTFNYCRHLAFSLFDKVPLVLNINTDLSCQWLGCLVSLLGVTSNVFLVLKPIVSEGHFSIEVVVHVSYCIDLLWCVDHAKFWLRWQFRVPPLIKGRWASFWGPRYASRLRSRYAWQSLRGCLNSYSTTRILFSFSVLGFFTMVWDSFRWLSFAILERLLLFLLINWVLRLGLGGLLLLNCDLDCMGCHHRWEVELFLIGLW